MKVSVLVPSEEYRTYAGARIRYGRLQTKLSELGVELKLEDITSFVPDRSECDVLLISKCHDARSLLAAAALSDRGRLVGVDLFDDYFSQSADSRLARFRTWLKQLLPGCDFALCSTRAMAGVVEGYRSDLPLHVVNDPADDFRLEELPAKLATKLTRTLDERKIRVAWFGVGENPHFRVGLSDLAAYGGALGSLGRTGLDVELTVLTNPRALDAQGLALIGQLPVRTTIGEWTEAREREVLGYAIACFLPVNAQGFSAAKSLNRAVTALSAGCQVISAGYPLYEPLGDLIYRDPESFTADLQREQMRFSVGSMDKFERAIDALASAQAEAVALARFLESLTPPRDDARPPVALIHGHAANGAAHKLVQSLQGLSAASPYCTAELGFDVVFRGETGRLMMLVSERAAGRLRPELRLRLRQSSRIAERNLWELPNDNEEGTDFGRHTAGWDEAPLPYQLATYRLAMERIRARMDEAFGPCRFIVSESSSLPFYSAN